MMHKEIKREVFSPQTPLDQLIQGLNPRSSADRGMAVRLREKADELARKGEIPQSYQKWIRTQLAGLGF